MNISTVYVSGGVGTEPMIVYPPKDGLRHIVIIGSSKTLCGIECDLWFSEWKTFDEKTIGCKRCKAAWRKR